MVDSYQGKRKDVEDFLRDGVLRFGRFRVFGISENNGLFTVFYEWHYE